MNSPLPKVLHPVGGSPMVYRTVQCLREVGVEEIRVVVGYGEDLVRQVVEPLGAVCFRQEKQRGTADAVRSAQPDTLSGPVLILNGDHPLIQPEDIRNVVKQYTAAECEVAVVSCEVAEPGNFGRIVRHHGSLKAIVEAKDAGAETLKIKEINTGIYMTEAETLVKLLPQIQSRNTQGEFYLTDIVSLTVEDGGKVAGLQLNPRLAVGVNTQKELAMASKQVFRNTVEAHMDNGVIVVDPSNTYVEEEATIASGTVIYPGCYIKGRTKIGSMCVLEPNCFLDSATLEDGVRLKAGSYIVQSKVGAQSEIGPYAHLRPETEIGKDCKVGNFVEMKKTRFGDGSKAGHLTYLGDAIVGKNVNVGCGTITCNYAADRKKYVTKIDDNVFVGSDTQFVAPIEIGKGAVIGSGSTITKNVPAGALAVARAKQVIKENYVPKGSGKGE